MKKIFTLAIIALASVAMVACAGQAEDKKVVEPAAEVACDKNCAECDKAATCPDAKLPAPAEAPAETPAK